MLFELSGAAPRTRSRSKEKPRAKSREKSSELKSRSQSRTGIEAHRIYRPTAESPVVEPERPTVIERFEAHYNLMGATKVGEDLKRNIHNKGLEMEKLRNRNKDRSIALTQLKKDNVLMRQDLSTYEANAIKELDL